MVLTKNGGIAIAFSLGAGYFLSRLRSTHHLQIDASSGAPHRRPKLPSSSADAAQADEEMKKTGGGGIAEIDEMKQEITDLKNSVQSLQMDRETTELDLEVQFQEFSRLTEQEETVRELVEKRVKIVDAETRQEISKLKERERRLEMRLLEYNNNKEKEIAELHSTVKTLMERETNWLMDFKKKEITAVKEELESRAKIAHMETQVFAVKIEAMQNNENKLLQVKASRSSREVASELSAAKKKIDVLRWKLRLKSRKAKENIAALQRKIAELQQHKESSGTTPILFQVQDDSNLENIEDVAQLRKVNSRLEKDNSDLTTKLEFIHRSNSEINDGEEEMRRLSQANGELKNQIDQLKMDHCSEIEKAVYLRWINACLRYELRNYQPAPGKATARDLNKSLSPKSAEKAKELIHEYALSSNDEEITSTNIESSLPNEDVEIEEVEKEEAIVVPTTNDDRSGKKSKLSLGKLKKLVTRKDSQKRNDGCLEIQASNVRSGRGCFSELSFSGGCKQSISSETPRSRRRNTFTPDTAEINQLARALKNDNSRYSIYSAANPES